MGSLSWWWVYTKLTSSTYIARSVTIKPSRVLSFLIIIIIIIYYYLIAFIMIRMLKKTREKNTFEQDTKTRDEGAGHTTERGSKWSAPSLFGKYTNTNYVNIKHDKKYKNLICKNDKNESLPQPIKSLSSSCYQLIEDYVTYCICSRSTSRC